MDKLDQSYVGEFGNRVEADAAAAKEAYRKAYEEWRRGRDVRGTAAHQPYRSGAGSI